MCLRLDTVDRGVVAGFSSDFGEVLTGCDGTERLSGASLSGVLDVPGYDQDRLAQARQYNRTNLSAAMWSLGSATELWLESTRAALASHVVLQHDTVGRMTAPDVIRATAHDGYHHVWDVGQVVGAGRD